MTSKDERSRRKAYSYLRFSTPEQRKGDSFRRQTTMAEQYARQHGLDLDDTLTFHDEGISGYRGANVEAGRLADFLEAVKVGLVPQGSVLLVEQLDRLSRMVPRRAVTVLTSIVDAGVSVVTLNDGREYTAEALDADPVSLLIAVVTFMRANEESALKARRLAASWENKRANIATKPMTSVSPAWLELDRAAGTFAVIPERAALVQRVYTMTLQGAGKAKIAETFNREGIPVWGRSKHWQRSYIQKMIDNPAVIGTFTPHVTEYVAGTKQRRPRDAVEGYYPAVVDLQTWSDVQALQSAQTAPTRGRHAHTPLNNLLAGLAACPRCGKTMTRVQKGKRSRPSFVCVGAKAGAGCEYKSVRYDQVERRVLQVLPGLMEDREGLAPVDELEERIWNLQQAIDRGRDDAEYIADQLVETRSAALVDRLHRLENIDLPAMQEELGSLQEQRDALAGPVVGSRIGKALAALQPPEGAELDRDGANRALRAVFKRAVINWPQGTLDFDWQAGGTCHVHYAWRGKPWSGTGVSEGAADTATD